MTDLPEALPILRHNTGATCGPAFGNVNHGDDDQARRPCLRTSLLTGVNGKRPSIRQLCWGNSVEAGEVAAAAAAAAGDEVSEWRGFDLIVVRGNIFLQPTTIRHTGQYCVCTGLKCDVFVLVPCVARDARSPS